MNKPDRYIIFGTGHDGKEVLKHIPKIKIAYFSDNNPKMVGKSVDGIEVISFQKMKELSKQYCVILAASSWRSVIKQQFERHKITNYIEYVNESYIAGKEYTISADKEKYSRSEFNKKLDSLVDESNEIDWFRDFDSAREIVTECMGKLDGQYAFYDTYFNESTLYGQCQTLMEYAGLDYEDFRHFPIVAHGPCFYGGHDEYRCAAIMCGRYDKKIHNDRYPYIPIFTVGPYMRYARSFYSEKEISEYKSKGKVGIVFVTHNTEKTFEDIRYTDDQLISKIISYNEDGKYGCFLVCVYWCDIMKPLYRKLSEMGIEVICAGFRFDGNFIRRQRSIFEIADDIIVLGFSSSVIHGLVMGKRIIFEDLESNTRYTAYQDYAEIVSEMETDEFKKAIKIIGKDCKLSMIQDVEEYDYLNELYGFSTYRTKEDIRMMYEIALDIWNACDDDMREYPFGVYKVYKKYQYNCDFDKLHMLTEAIGHRLWSQ